MPPAEPHGGTQIAQQDGFATSTKVPMASAKAASTSVTALESASSQKKVSKPVVLVQKRRVHLLVKSGPKRPAAPLEMSFTVMSA